MEKVRKNKRNELKEMKGITLVALVVTIILLLILAGISITTLTGSGLFEKAKEANDRYENAQDEEKMQIAKYSNEIESYINGERNEIKNNFRLIKENCTSNEIQTITVNDIPNYKNLTSDNFILKFKKINHQGDNGENDIETDIALTYDKNEGKLTIGLNRVRATSSGIVVYAIYDVYVMY